ncbi:DegT/DnrJ/EryC1/StrS family aminotransferase, partial [Bacteroides fragilis]
LESAHPDNLPIANRIANSVICLPMHHSLTFSGLDRITSVIFEGNRS